MIFAQKGNRVRRIEEFQISEFLEQGYDIINESGSVLQEAVPTDLSALKKAYVDNKKRIEELEKELESLKKAPKKTVAKDTEVSTETKPVEVEEKPKRSSKKDK